MTDTAFDFDLIIHTRTKKVIFYPLSFQCRWILRALLNVSTNLSAYPLDFEWNGEIVIYSIALRVAKIV